jgi:DNA-binding transcriptional LysR family regulator
VLFKEAKALLARAELLVLDVKAAGTGQSGSLRLSHSRSIEPGKTYTIVEDFRRHFGNVTLSTETAWTGKNLEMIAAGDIDAAFVQLPVDDPNIDRLPIGQQELVAAVPSSHPIAGQSRIRPSDLRSLPMVHFPRHQGPGYYDSIIRQIWATEAPQLGAEESDAEHMLAAVADSKGFAILERVRGFRMSPNGVTIIRFEDPVPKSTFGLAWNKQSPSPVTRQFVKHCHEYSLGSGQSQH